MKWAQTDPESCGAAALMVALSEAGIGMVGAEREIELWGRIRASGPYRGSIPGRIALEAQRQGMVSGVWVDPDRIALATSRLGGQAAFDIPALLAEHARALDAARRAGVAVEEKPTDAREMVQTVRDGAALMAGFVVPLSGGQIALHWRLYRLVGITLWEMDPNGGNEAPKTEAQLKELLNGGTYIGVAVTLRRA